MAIPGYLVDIKLPGSAIAFTTEAMTNVSGNTWQITNAAKRVWAPTATITASTGTILSVDRLFGTITFTGSVASPTVTGQYLPMTSIAQARSYTRSLRATNQDSTIFIAGAAATAYRSRQQTVLDCAATFDRFYGDSFFSDALDADDQIVAQFFTDYSASEAEGAMWARIVDINTSAQWDSLVVESISVEGTTDNDGRSFSFSPN